MFGETGTVYQLLCFKNQTVFKCIKFCFNPLFDLDFGRLILSVQMYMHLQIRKCHFKN